MRFLYFSVLLLIFTTGSAQDVDVVASVHEFQERMNKEFKDPEESPLTSEDREDFESLDFFPVDTAFSVIAEFVRTPYEMPFEMPTTTSRKPVYVKYGEVYFNLEGEEYKLNVYQNQELIQKPPYEDYLFLPFTDLTNGTSSYSGGRYIDMRIPKTNKVTIDFNKAYNPYCAYNGKYSCPIPPAENHLDLKVSAGVKNYKK